MEDSPFDDIGFYTALLSGPFLYMCTMRWLLDVWTGASSSIVGKGLMGWGRVLALLFHMLFGEWLLLAAVLFIVLLAFTPFWVPLHVLDESLVRVMDPNAPNAVELSEIISKTPEVKEADYDDPGMIVGLLATLLMVPSGVVVFILRGIATVLMIAWLWLRHGIMLVAPPAVIAFAGIRRMTGRSQGASQQATHR